MIKIINIIALVLKKYRYRNKRDPFQEFNSIKKESVFNSEKGNILLLPIRVTPTSNTFEGVIGYALKLRGYKVHALMCGQLLTKCENINQKQNFSLACSLCNYEQNRFSTTFNIENSKYLEEIGKYEYNKLLDLSYSVHIEKIFSYTYKNVSIGSYVEGGVARYLLLSNIDIEKYEKLIREFFLTALLSVEATKSILERTKPKFVISSHGIYSTWGASIETCIADGYHVIVWGRGYIGKGNLVLSHNASYLFDTINESSEYWETTQISNKIKKEISIYFKNKRNPHSNVDHVNYYADIEKIDNNIFEILKLDINRKRIGIYPNIPWDGKMFSATEEFSDLNIFVKAIIEWAKKNPDVDLIIRAHPAEAYRKGNESIERFIDIINQECTKLPNNIKYIEPTSTINSYELSEICDAALMYASTLALEFAYAKHPVIQVGLNNVSNKGLVFDAPTKKKMFDYLDKAISNQLEINDLMYQRIVQYSDYWINKRHIPEELLDLKHLTFDGYTFSDTTKLNKGNYQILDWIIDCCEENKPFIWDDDA